MSIDDIIRWIVKNAGNSTVELQIDYRYSPPPDHPDHFHGIEHEPLSFAFSGPPKLCVRELATSLCARNHALIVACEIQLTNGKWILISENKTIEGDYNEDSRLPAESSTPIIPDSPVSILESRWGLSDALVRAANVADWQALCADFRSLSVWFYHLDNIGNVKLEYLHLSVSFFTGDFLSTLAMIEACINCTKIDLTLRLESDPEIGIDLTLLPKVAANVDS